MSQPFLPRSITPDPGEFTEIVRYWNDPAYARQIDTEREVNRRAAYDQWSAGFDARHPLGPERERELMVNAGLSDAEIEAALEPSS